MRQKLKYQDVPNFCLWFLLPRRAHSELCNQSGSKKHGQKGKRDWYFNKCIIPKDIYTTKVTKNTKMDKIIAPVFRGKKEIRRVSISAAHCTIIAA